MSTTPKPSVQHPNTTILHDAITASAYSKAIAIGGFKTKQISINTDSMGSGDELDIDFMISNQHDVDFETASAIGNRWTLCQVKTLLSQSASNGTLNIADSDENHIFVLNTDGARYLCVKVTFTATGHSVTIALDLFEKHNEEDK